MPLFPPVMTATFPSSLLICFSYWLPTCLCLSTLCEIRLSTLCEIRLCWLSAVTTSTNVISFLTHFLNGRFTFTARSIEGCSGESTGHQLACHLTLLPCWESDPNRVWARGSSFACKPAIIEGENQRGEMESPGSFSISQTDVDPNGAHARQRSA